MDLKYFYTKVIFVNDLIKFAIVFLSACAVFRI